MIKMVAYVNRLTACDMDPTDTKSAIISISSDDKLADLCDGWIGRLNLTFDDVDAYQDITILGEGKRPIVVFNEDMAKSIIEFVESMKDKVDTIVVHCDAGISRSAGVAKFVAEKYNLPFNHDYPLYNKKVYRTLINVNRE